MDASGGEGPTLTTRKGGPESRHSKPGSHRAEEMAAEPMSPNKSKLPKGSLRSTIGTVRAGPRRKLIH